MLEEYLGLRNHGTINGSNEERAFEMWVDNLFDIADYPPNMNGAGFGLLFSWCKQVRVANSIKVVLLQKLICENRMAKNTIPKWHK